MNMHGGPAPVCASDLLPPLASGSPLGEAPAEQSHCCPREGLLPAICSAVDTSTGDSRWHCGQMWRGTSSSWTVLKSCSGLCTQCVGGAAGLNVPSEPCLPCPVVPPDSGRAPDRLAHLVTPSLWVACLCQLHCFPLLVFGSHFLTLPCLTLLALTHQTEASRGVERAGKVLILTAGLASLVQSPSLGEAFLAHRHKRVWCLQKLGSSFSPRSKLA